MPKICSVEGCGGKHQARGLCQRHYNALPEQITKRTAHQRTPEYKITLKTYYETPNGKARALANARKYKYGMSPEDQQLLFDMQNGRCAICGTHQRDLKKALAIDHDHDTGNIRGLLCGNCNRGIGQLKDDPGLLRQAADYLERDSEALPCPTLTQS